MGFLDFLLKRETTKGASLKEVEGELEQAKEEATESFNAVTHKKLVKQKTEELLAALNALEGAKPNVDHHYSGVASGFKNEYVLRVRSALTPLLDLTGDYRYKASQGVGEALKATAENQYFTQYYAKQVKAVATALRGLEEAFRELRLEEEKVEEKAAPFKHALKAVKAYADSLKELDEKTGEYKETVSSQEHLAEEEAKLSTKRRESKALDDAGREALRERINAEKARAKIANALKPLSPAFSALARTGVTEAKAFSLDAVTSILEKGKPAYDALIRLMDGKTSELGDVAVRGTAHAKIIDEELRELITEFSRADAARREAERNALPLKALEDELNRVKRGLKEATQRVDSLAKEMEALVESGRRLKPDAEQAASSALNRKIAINVEHTANN